MAKKRFEEFFKERNGTFGELKWGDTEESIHIVFQRWQNTVAEYFDYITEEDNGKEKDS